MGVGHSVRRSVVAVVVVVAAAGVDVVVDGTRCVYAMGDVIAVDVVATVIGIGCHLSRWPAASHSAGLAIYQVLVSS